MTARRVRGRIVPAVCVVGMAAALVGCGGGGGEDAKPVAATSSTAVTQEPTKTPSPKPGLALVDDEESTDAGQEIVVEVLENDTATLSDAPFAPLEDVLQAEDFTLTVDSPASHGTAEVDGTGITYTPTAGYGGEDEFTYRVEVKAGAGAEAVSATAVVRITVTKPEPKPTPTPTPKPKTKPKVSYANCDAVRAAGAAPIHEGEPGYGSHLDRDGDGVGCEPYNGGGTSGGSGGSDGGGTSGGGSGSTYYANCSAARSAGAAPVRVGDPGYGRHLDRDGDGVGCE
ncbi:excalibur calcium-binding domain-containing protein [Streptomyces sp. NPDC096176]|uniref:excalibur calcium-binding domain-containing protein n=1 Tax=Streptomyces sp. NPDC096176 TaxID=3366079 RepID=UPI00382CE072